MAAETAGQLRASRTQFWAALLITFMVVQAINLLTTLSVGENAEHDQTRVLFTVLGHFVFGIICFRFSRAIGHPIWLSVVLGIVACFALAYLISILWLILT
jgi:VanZ family protein